LLAVWVFLGGFIGDIEAGRNSTIVKFLCFFGETGAVVKIDVPEGEPSVREPAKAFTPRQLEKRLAGAQLARGKNEILRAQGVFGHNAYNPGPHTARRNRGLEPHRSNG
jgi:hypothetical protein